MRLLAYLLMGGGLLLAGTSGLCLAGNKDTGLFGLLTWIFGGGFFVTGIGMSIAGCIVLDRARD